MVKTMKSLILMLTIPALAILTFLAFFLLPAESDFCDQVEKDATKIKGLRCECYPTSYIPLSLREKNVTPKCYCTCARDGKVFNFSVVQAPGAETELLTP